MEQLIIPKNYKSTLSIKETQHAIKFCKDFFERELARQLNLTRVSAPLFVKPETGLNDNLSGTERPVKFGLKEQEDAEVEIVHSLAKWKRLALKNYCFELGEGLYTDMNAIRRDEITDNIHSIFVDQWDWELIIHREERTMESLKSIVRKVYTSLKITEKALNSEYSFLGEVLPEDIFFITAQELEDLYPNSTAKEREYNISKEHGAVFISQIGGKLRSGKPHDGRAPDYDDWSLNGDILVYYDVLDIALELSSMGIRVDSATLLKQLEVSDCMDRAELPFQKALINNELPYTVGGGIGQSRMCMFFLKKAHIGEVQSSVWPDEMIEETRKNGIFLL
ncbi:MAG: aspartate--ammonia ligase [Clostridiales bacterium]|nr:aspartate--ammonia ligase [Clostridiales bacterium]